MGLTFSPGPHTYLLDDRPVPSVTGVLKALGLIRLDQIPSRTLEAARQRGEDVHRLLQFENDHDLDVDSVDPAYAGYLEAWERFQRERGFQVVLVETRVASRRHRVAGTLDCLGLLDGHGAIVDYKTGSPDDVAADFQTAAYEGLLREWALEGDDAQVTAVLRMPEFRRIERLAVRLYADGNFKVSPYQDPTDFSKFLTLTAAFHIAASRGVDLTVDELAA